MPSETHYTCPRCQIGYLKPDHATYSGVIRGMLVSVPNVPSWTCDVCQHREFDEMALVEIEAFIGQSSLPEEGSRPTSKRAPVEGETPVARRQRLKT